MVDPQGRSAARLAQRRGYVPAAAAGLGAAGGDVFESPCTAQPRKSRKKWILAALGVVVLLGLGVGLGVGLTVGKKSSNSASTSNAATTGNTTKTTTTGDDPSVFDKDSRLHNSFWAFAYTPQVRLLPHPSIAKLTQPTTERPPPRMRRIPSKRHTRHPTPLPTDQQAPSIRRELQPDRARPPSDQGYKGRS